MPTDDEQALAIYERLADYADRSTEPPSPRMLAYIEALTARYPDLDDLPEDQVDNSPWAGGPRGDALGPFLYLTLVYSRVDEALPFIAETARAPGLVCFDPQTERLI